MRVKVIGILLVLIVISVQKAQSTITQQNLKWNKDMVLGLNQSEIQKITLNNNPASIWLASAKAVYQKSFNSTIYQTRLNLPSQVSQVYDLHLANGGETVYVATDQGLYQSIDEGRHWQKVYDSSDESKRVCFSVIEIGDDIFLGTQKGLQHRLVDENSWKKVVSISSEDAIHTIKEINGNIYALSNHALYEIDVTTLRSKELYRQGVSANEMLDMATDEDEKDLADRMVIDLAFDSSSQQFILATATGMMISTGPKFQWSLLTTLPVSSAAIQSLISSSYRHGTCPGSDNRCLGLYLASDEGMYTFVEGTWRTINDGLFSPRVNDLTMDDEGKAYAATDYGVYTLSLKESSGEKNEVVTDINDNEFSNEPTIKQVQAWAIEYADVSNQKVKEWKKLSKRSALYPSLSMGADGGRDWSRGDSIYGATSGGGTHYIAPDDKSSGEDVGFDVSLSWDLGDFIWSTDQTTIDSRAKLMVELRDDILTQITRLYFERRRLQIDLKSSDDEIDILDKQMRIMEITALLDASTGGKFSEAIN